MTIALAASARTRRAEGFSGLRDALGDVLGERPVSVTLERTHFPGGRPVQQVFCAELPDGRRKSVIAECCGSASQTHADEIRTSLAKSRNGQKAGLDATAIVVEEGLGLVLRRPGLDERLPGLRLLHDPAFARQAVQMVFGEDFGPLDVELVAHRLGKRAVLRLRGAEVDVFVRLRSIKSGDGDIRFERHRALWRSMSGQTDLRIPEPLGALPEIGASFFAVLPGEPADFQTADVRVVVSGVAALQALNPVGLPVHTAADEARILWLWLERCRDGLPETARRIAPGLKRLVSVLEQASFVPRPCHRDLHEKQVLISDGVAGLLDFDTLCLSDPALDAGNLLAHLFLSGQDEALLRAELDFPGIGLWRSAALYRLAMIYAMTSTPDPVLERLIEEAGADAFN